MDYINQLKNFIAIKRGTLVTCGVHISTLHKAQLFTKKPNKTIVGRNLTNFYTNEDAAHTTYEPSTPHTLHLINELTINSHQVLKK